MAKENIVSTSNELDKIYEDTAFFVDAITSEYGFYSAFIKALESGRTGMSIERKNVRKTVEAMWVEAIEAALPAIDAAIRHPSTGIAEKEEVLPIEFSHHITEKSLRHLAQHTDYIDHIEGDVIMPSKILNVYYDENKQTYENKFLNTLIDRLMLFITQRYSTFKERGLEETDVTMSFESEFKLASSSGKINLTIETMTPTGNAVSDSMFERVRKIYGIIAQYKDSEFVKSMEGAMITSPVMRTNAIKKNKYLSQCLELWDFIESYEKVGYTVEAAGQSEEASDEYVKKLYSILAIQYLAYTYNLNNSFSGNDELLSRERTEKLIKPEYIRKLEVLEADKFNIYDTEFKKIINVFGGPSQRKYTVDEAKIRDAVSLALKEDRNLMSEFKKAKKTAAQTNRRNSYGKKD